MKNIAIEKATLKDVPILTTIKKESFKPLYEKYKDEGNPYLTDESYIIEKMKNSNMIYYKIRLDDNICGGIRIIKKESNIYRIGVIYISSKYKNKRIAQTVLNMIFEKYKHITTWELDCPISEIINVKCYEKVGFKDTKIHTKINDKLIVSKYIREI